MIIFLITINFCLNVCFWRERYPYTCIHLTHIFIIIIFSLYLLLDRVFIMLQMNKKSLGDNLKFTYVAYAKSTLMEICV